MSTSDLETALASLAAAPAILVASDFDGVLAPFVLDPMDARPQPGTMEVLTALAALPRTHAAVVSGRDLDTLTTLTGLTGAAAEAVTRIGSHGAQTSQDQAASVTEAERVLLGHLVDQVQQDVAAHDPRIRLEHKPAAVVLHTRGLGDDAARAADEIAGRAAEREGVRLLTGKGVLELSVVHADKGTALRALADDLGVDATLYLGDDVTDEHAFAVLHGSDMGIKVGEGETAAAWRVGSCEDVPEVLSRIHAARRAATA